MINVLIVNSNNRTTVDVVNRTITTVELVNNRTLSQWHSRNATGIPIYSNSIAALPNPTVL